MSQFVNWYTDAKIRPIKPMRIFAANEVAEAFKYMQSGKHMGKIVIRMPRADEHVSAEPIKLPMTLDPTKAYIVVGGLGGIGRALGNWLVERGARHLIILSRSAGSSEISHLFSSELERQGCAVHMVAGDVSRSEDVTKAFSRAAGKVIGGVIQMSMVLQVCQYCPLHVSTAYFEGALANLRDQDESLAKMTHAQWLQTTQPKVNGTYNLHLALKEHERGLDFFVLFSSMSGIVGTVGQSNYAAANSFLDAFVTYRRQKGLLASVLNLGVVEDIGCVHEDSATLKRVKATGARTIREANVVEALHAAILSSKSSPCRDDHTSSVMMIGVSSTKSLSAPGVTPLWGLDLRFSTFENLWSKTGQEPEAERTDLKEFLGEIENNPDLLDDPLTEIRIMTELCKLINAHMARDESENEDMASIPIDSLMSIEIRNWFRRQLAMDISLTEISKAGTVGGLSRICVSTLKERYATSEKGPQR